jgi:hypothetical protein
MGRGRAKAKQTKVARELKYNTGSLDPDRLKRELEAGGFSAAPSSSSDDDDEDDYADPYASDEDDDEDETATR